MAANEEKRSDYYEVLGLKKECSAAELRNAYKKLAMKWHPDRCSAAGNARHVEEAKKKFQAIQQAYSVLSDANKRFLYDVGVYDCDDDDDENGMGDFLNEMAAMMNQNKSTENREESFQDLQELFEEMFQSDMDAFASSSSSSSSSTCSSSSSLASCSSNNNNKRNSSEPTFNFGGFCIGMGTGGKSGMYEERKRRYRSGGCGGNNTGAAGGKGSSNSRRKQ
ncbi:hypothetical protein M9H77_15207 [Catharanthus roseus]|uniref:Uncharacterized protein n=1 Tax=Catharanthus roseus TaxID=4058 RepID=A0ACC0AYY9_CATRO|nr:hypothetical protein M9H77_15207 [Catharanthus roseus]